MLGIINYGAGNFRSVCNALEYLQVDFTEITRPEEMDSLTHVILPGVGAFKDCVSRLKSIGVFDRLKSYLDADNKYFLGICVGHQVLSSLGTEFEEVNGLDIVGGKTVKIDYKDGYPVPHTGWSEVKQTRSSPLFDGIKDNSPFYFVHSYYIECNSQDLVTSEVDYGKRIVSSVQRGKAHGVQFHPEKSQHNGLKLLMNFARLSD